MIYRHAGEKAAIRLSRPVLRRPQLIAESATQYGHHAGTTAAHRLGEANAGIGDLSRIRLSAKLTDHLGHLGQSRRTERVTASKAAAVGVGRQPAFGSQASCLGEFGHIVDADEAERDQCGDLLAGAHVMQGDDSDVVRRRLRRFEGTLSGQRDL